MKVCGYYVIIMWNYYVVDIYYGIVIWFKNVVCIFSLFYILGNAVVIFVEFFCLIFIIIYKVDIIFQNLLDEGMEVQRS